MNSKSLKQEVLKLIEKTGKLMSYLPESIKRKIATLPYHKIKNKKVNSFCWYFFSFISQNSKYPIMTLRNFDNYTLSLDLSSYANRRSFYFNGKDINEDLQILINDLLTEDDVYIDIGANIGHTVLMASKRVKKIIAFEPVEEMLKHFRRNMKINDVNNVVLYDFALSDKKGVAKIKVSNTNDGSHTLNPDFGNLINGIYEKEVKIETEKFDNLKIDKATMVKIDVEGHELKVLEGMSESINKVSYVICETSITNYDALQEFFKNHGFKQIKEYGDKKSESVTIMNLLFINKKKVADIEKIRKLCNNSH